MTNSDLSNSVVTTLNDWREREKKALELIRLAGELRFDRSIDLILFRRDIYDCRPSELIQLHDFSTNYIEQALDLDTTIDIARHINDNKDIQPARIDIGIVATDFFNNEENSLDAFLSGNLKFLLDSWENEESTDVVLYGFGRIGRLLLRRLIGQTGRGDQLRLRAIVLRQKMKTVQEELEKRAALLEEDSIHGPFRGTIKLNAADSSLTINGNKVFLIFSNDPTTVDYAKYGIKDHLVIDNTGIWRDDVALSQHLKAGASKVMLTAPGNGIPNIVYGANHESIDLDNQKIISAASCTTNAIVPVIKVLDEKVGVISGHIETIHAYTSDQNLLDNFHKKPRRGRGAAVNMVITSTGAAKAVSKVLPHLEGKLTGNAVRVPTPNVSLAILNLKLKDTVTVDQINGLLRDASLHGPLVEQVHYSTSSEFVSTTGIGTTSTSVIDSPSTLVSHDGYNATIYAWYDNEFGYCCQVVRLAKHFARVRRKSYY